MGREKGNINILDLEEKLANEESLNQRFKFADPETENEMVELKTYFQQKRNRKDSELTVQSLMTSKTPYLGKRNTLLIYRWLNQTKSDPQVKGLNWLFKISRSSRSW